MKKEISEKIEIPEGVEFSVEENMFIIKGPQGENKKKFDLKDLVVHKEHNHILISCKKATKKRKKENKHPKSTSEKYDRRGIKKI